MTLVTSDHGYHGYHVLAVDVCNRFSSLPIEDPQVMASSAEELPETEKGRSQGGSDHSSDKLELAAEMMMHRSSSQEFSLAISRNQFEKRVPVLKCILIIVVAILSCAMVPVVQNLKPTIKRLHSSKHNRSSQLRRNLVRQMLQHLQLSLVTSTPL